LTFFTARLTARRAGGTAPAIAADAVVAAEDFRRPRQHVVGLTFPFI
jgi:hypothetical protein